MRVVLFIFFNRPQPTLRVLQRIIEASPDLIILASDGPRTYPKLEQITVSNLRENVEVECKKNAVPFERIYAPANQGCARWVSTAIELALKKYNECIVLEDDCLPHPSFFEYCWQMLDRYRDSDEIKAITGTNLAKIWREGVGYGFTSFPNIWGWATWQRAWSGYSLHIINTREDELQYLVEEGIADAEGVRQWKLMLTFAKQNPLHTWDYQFIMKTIVERGLCVFPHVNLISNIGYGPDATHTKNKVGKFADLKTSPYQNIDKQPAKVRDPKYDQFAQNEYFHDRATLKNTIFKIRFKMATCWSK